jgi:hypothetical protein
MTLAWAIRATPRMSLTRTLPLTPMSRPAPALSAVLRSPSSSRKAGSQSRVVTRTRAKVANAAWITIRMMKSRT